MDMTAEERIRAALRFSDVPIESGFRFRLLAEGAWHRAYRVTLFTGESLVVRLKKKNVYGEQVPFDEKEWIAEYESVALFYRAANRCRQGICPTRYYYKVDPENTFTVESDLGETVPIKHLCAEEALDLGRDLGEFYRQLHRQKPELEGWGEPIPKGNKLIGEDLRPPALILQEKNDDMLRNYGRLAASDLPFDRPRTERSLERALSSRRWDRASLVNRDLTPENWMGSGGRLTGIIDPVPRLDDGTRYAAFFYHCYSLLLPAYLDAPRYERHAAHWKPDTLDAIAEGFLRGYADGSESLLHSIRLEHLLWVFDEITAHWRILQGDITRRTRLRMGAPPIIQQRLVRFLAELDRLTADIG
ncbi:hypothetical protein GCM10007416_30560 [Kroppenstedtia guangzhouensis]|uniref:Phosphotransferase enzyme family protein n=2 Tax=Kroppenstedtia guangzhouensis TaxID=1274356 RepID=A0ABQ1H2A6_9BACL|nr:hypothetical protein GCM10007416_30560 [Kroppenstedtia guangzhouensis]